MTLYTVTITSAYYVPVYVLYSYYHFRYDVLLMNHYYTNNITSINSMAYNANCPKSGALTSIVYNANCPKSGALNSIVYNANCTESGEVNSMMYNANCPKSGEVNSMVFDAKRAKLKIV